MKSEHLVGTSIPRFTFDTPTTPGNDFYKLCEGEHPLVMVFLPAFDHPVTREYLTRYLQTLPRLRGVRLACVVRSSPRTVAKATQGAEFPFTLICDAPGVLYGYLGVEQTRGLLSWSFAAQKIYKAARDAGYHYDTKAPQLLPLTLVLSWYEQKAVCILLTLLYLGIKDIRLGPTLPAFLSPNVLDYLVKNFGIAPITTPEEDLKAILG